MTVRTGYVPQRSNRHDRVTGLPQKRRLLWEGEEQRNERAFVFYTEASDMQLVTTKRTTGDETPGAILWAGTTFGKSGKLKRGSLRYGEAVELADALGYDIVWQKRK